MIHVVGKFVENEYVVDLVPACTWYRVVQQALHLYRVVLAQQPGRPPESSCFSLIDCISIACP